MAISVKIADTTYRCVDNYSIRQQGSGVSSTTLNVLLEANDVPLVFQTAQVLIDGVAFFLGLIQNVGTPEYSTAYETQIFSLSVSSLECLLNFRNVKHNFYLSSAPTYSDVVQWIYTNIIAEENITLGAISLTEKTYTSSLKIVNQKASSVLDDICNKVGNAAWWISADRKFYFRVSTDFTNVVAPTHLSELKLTENIGTLRTSEIIVGASAKITATESNADLIADIAARTGGSGKIEVVESDSTIHNTTKAGTEAVDRLARNAESEKTITCLCHDLTKSTLYNLWPLTLTIGGVSITGDFVVVERTISHRLDSEFNIRVTLKNANYFAHYGYALHQAAEVAKAATATLNQAASDNAFTPDKKIRARADWATVAAEVAGYDAQASASGVLTAKAAYDAAFQALADYLNGGSTWTSGLPLWLSADEMSVTEEIDGTTYEATWNAYYSARTALQLAINSVANIRADLSNDRQSVTTDVNGAGGDYSFCLTTLSIYLGAADDSAAWTFDAVPSAGVTGTKSNANRTYQVTAMSTDDGYVDLTASREGYASITKRFSISKSKTGAAGTSPTSYGLFVDVASVGKSIAGAYTPASINVSAKSTTGGAGPVAYAGRFIIATYDGSTWTDRYTSSGNESSKAYTPPASITAIRVRLYLAGGTATLLDEETIPVVSDGATGAPGANALVMTSATTPSGTYDGQIGIWKSQLYTWSVSENKWNLADAVLPTDAPALQLSFDEKLDFPDDSTGAAYQHRFSDGYDSWAVTNGAISLVNGRIRVTSSGGNTYIQRSVVSFPGNANQLVTVRVNANKPMALKLLWNTTGADRSLSLDIVSGVAVYQYPVNTKAYWGEDITSLYFYVAGMSAGDWFEIETIYIGTGACATPEIDNSGNGNHSSSTNALPAVGVSGKCARFLGGQNIRITGKSLPSGDCSVSLWAYFENMAASGVLLSQSSYAYNESRGIYFANDYTVRIWARNSSGSWQETASPVITIGAWHHLVFEQSAGIISLYIDTVLSATLNIGTPLTDYIGNLGIGGYYGNNNNNFVGKIDELIFYTRALTAPERIGLYLAKRLKTLYMLADYRMEHLGSTAILPACRGLYPYGTSPAVAIDGDLVVWYSATAANCGIYKYSSSTATWTKQTTPTADQISKCFPHILNAVASVSRLDSAGNTITVAYGTSADYINGSTSFETLLVNFLYALNIVMGPGGSIRSYQYDDGAKGFLIDSETGNIDIRGGSFSGQIDGTALKVRNAFSVETTVASGFAGSALIDPLITAGIALSGNKYLATGTGDFASVAYAAMGKNIFGQILLKLYNSSGTVLYTYYRTTTYSQAGKLSVVQVDSVTTADMVPSATDLKGIGSSSLWYSRTYTRAKMLGGKIHGNSLVESDVYTALESALSAHIPRDNSVFIHCTGYVKTWSGGGKYNFTVTRLCRGTYLGANCYWLEGCDDTGAVSSAIRASASNTLSLSLSW